jgi:hypothetical protein
MRNSQKGFVPILIVIIAVAILIGGGAYIVGKKSEQKHSTETPTQSASNTQQVATTTTPSPATTTKPTATTTTKTPGKTQRYVITLLSPKGGETLIKGTVYPIRWTVTPDLNAIQFEIGLYDINSSGISPPIAKVIGKAGVYNWIVPQDLPDGKYKIALFQIRSTDGAVANTTGDFFTMVSSSGPPCRNRTCDPLLKRQVLYRLS